MSPAVAAIDPAKRQALTATTELVVIEQPNCAYCDVFRRRLLPAYAASPQSRDIPMRFVRVRELSRSGLAIRQPISIVPTVLVIEDGREIGRIPGLTGQNLFFRAIDHILKQR